MTKPLSLDALREAILANQQAGIDRPSAPARKVVVDQESRIMLRRDADADPEHLTDVPQDIFAASYARLARDRDVVRRKFPRNARELQVSGVVAWTYSVIDELGQPYELCAYYDDGLYQVRVLSPEVEGRYEPHTGHLFADGRICLSQLGGVPSLEDAYAKSVLWATGFSVFQRTGQFPFSLNNEND